MKAEIIAVGTELLMGQIANTNAQFLSRELSEMGIDVHYHHVVGDNMQRVVELIQTVLKRCDLIITTGGLGPTMDDLTKDAIAQALNKEMVLDEESKTEIENFFSMIHKNMTINNMRQAYFPEGSIILKNPNGTAPGCIVESEGKAIVVLPGPPMEMQPMFYNHVLPYLSKKTGSFLRSKHIKIFGMGESSLETALMHLIDGQTNPTLATYATGGELLLRVTAKAESEKEALTLLEPVCDEISEILGSKIYSYTNESLAQVVINKLYEQKKHVSFAESCTGGMLTSMLIDIPGASNVINESFVTYSNEAKINRLNVDPATLEEHGAVSEQTAAEMAKGLREATGCDIAVSVTGIAGPEDAGDKKAGLVYISLYDGKKATTIKYQGRSNREYNRRFSSLNALNMVRLCLLGEQ
ncbi:MAG: competence/damage-inducible protein A [Clostridia bacterium]|nr:competence/damage-inducible protein A [Clostridia bacterium]